MSGTHYDPNKKPDASEWLAIDEHERIRLAQNYHVASRIKLSNPKLHALRHASVENQIAQGHGPSRRAMERLQKEGLTRHEAIHAVASIFSAGTHDLVSGERSSERGNEIQREINAKLDALSAAKWKSRAK